MFLYTSSQVIVKVRVAWWDETFDVLNLQKSVSYNILKLNVQMKVPTYQGKMLRACSNLYGRTIFINDTAAMKLNCLTLLFNFLKRRYDMF